MLKWNIETDEGCIVKMFSASDDAVMVRAKRQSFKKKHGLNVFL